MRQRYIQCPITLELVPAEKYWGPSQSKSAYIQADIQPYQSMVTGEIITSRSKHREHLRQHNCFEIGNEVNAAMTSARPQQRDDKEARRRTIAEVMNAKGY